MKRVITFAIAAITLSACQLPAPSVVLVPGGNPTPALPAPTVTPETTVATPAATTVTSTTIATTFPAETIPATPAPTTTPSFTPGINGLDRYQVYWRVIRYGAIWDGRYQPQPTVTCTVTFYGTTVGGHATLAPYVIGYEIYGGGRSETFIPTTALTRQSPAHFTSDCPSPNFTVDRWAPDQAFVVTASAATISPGYPNDCLFSYYPDMTTTTPRVVNVQMGTSTSFITSHISIDSIQNLGCQIDYVGRA